MGTDTEENVGGEVQRKSTTLHLILPVKGKLAKAIICFRFVFNIKSCKHEYISDS
jgi:hypothetical protein